MIIKPTTPKIYVPQDDSCVLNLDARDVRGGKIYDRSGKGNHGAISGAVIKPANYGLPILEFDGTDDYVNCGNDTSLDITEITIEAWIRPNVLQEQYIIWKADPSGDNITKGYTFIIASGNLYLRLGDGTVKHQLFGAHGMAINNWYHVIAVYDGSYMKIYKNGKLLSTSPEDIFTISPADTRDLTIGKGGYSGQLFNGSIDGVHIYNRVLSASEISKIFNKLRHIYGI